MVSTTWVMISTPSYGLFSSQSWADSRIICFMGIDSSTSFLFMQIMVESSSRQYSFSMSVNLSHLYMVNCPVIQYFMFSKVHYSPSCFTSSSFSMVTSFSSLSICYIWLSFRSTTLLWFCSSESILLISFSDLALYLNTLSKFYFI